MTPVIKIIAANRRPLVRSPLRPVCHDHSDEESSPSGVLEAAYFLTIGGGLLGWWIGGQLEWWVESSRELLTGLGYGFALAVIITAIDLHSRKAHPNANESAPRGGHTRSRTRAWNNSRGKNFGPLSS
jgi:cyanate permease